MPVVLKMEMGGRVIEAAGHFLQRSTAELFSFVIFFCQHLQLTAQFRAE